MHRILNEPLGDQYEDLERKNSELQEANRRLSEEIAAKERVQQELTASKQLLSSIVESVQEGIVACDRDGRLLCYNRSADEILGVSRADALLESWSDSYHRIHPEKAQGPVDMLPLGKATRGERMTGEERTIRNPRSTEDRTISINAAPLLSDSDVPAGGVVTFKDVTEAKKREAEREQLARDLAEASHTAGMAEVATGVLHNVGNVLNSINTSSSIIAERIRTSLVTDLRRACTLIADHQGELANYITNDERGRQLPEFLIRLAEKLNDERTEMAAEVEGLSRRVEHVKEIISVQQSLACKSGVREEIDLRDLVEDALTTVSAAFERHAIEIVREYDETLPTLLTDKHKLLQIVINLIANAKNALLLVDEANRRMTVRVNADSPDHLTIEIEDTGIGISPANLRNIFQHGFTTRKDGHGFGLHSGANAASSLGGSLKAFSDGEGHGAVFHLELPVSTPGRDRTVHKTDEELVLAGNAVGS